MKIRSLVFTVILIMFLLILPAGCCRKGAVETTVSDSSAVAFPDDSAPYPSKPINVIVAYKEGGGTDISAKLICKAAERYIGQPLEIENIVGTDGELGYTELCNAKPDGYTIGFINLPTFLSIPLSRSTLYSINDVEPIANIVYDPGVLAVKADSSMESLSDLIEAAEGNPGCIRIGNNGYGASDHIMAAVIAKEAGIDVSHVPFPGTSDMIDALEKGYIDVTAAKISEVASQAERGDLRILCIFSDERFPEFPDVPTAKELGVDIEFGSARALAAPKDTPKHIIGYLSDAFRLAIEDPETVEAAHGSSIPLFYMSPDELSLLIDGMMERRDSWADLIESD